MAPRTSPEGAKQADAYRLSQAARSMTWLEGGACHPKPAGLRLRALLERPGILPVPGAHHALAALLAKRAGFEALYLSGAALSASMGLPDLGVMTLDELCFFTRTIHRASDLPLIVDADTGYGEALNVMRTVRELETAGAAAIQLEDQELPKKCGHLSDKRLLGAAAMAAKIEAAKRARSHALIIARTDAAAAGLDKAIARVRLYVEAGADVVFPEALTAENDFRALAHALDVPLLANMTEFGRTPYFTASEFEAMGYKIVIWPVSSLRVAAKAMEDLYARMRSEGSAAGALERMLTRAELYDLLGYPQFEALDRSIAQSVLPGDPEEGRDKQQPGRKA
jgi:methylisocitrate lyase